MLNILLVASAALLQPQDAPASGSPGAMPPSHNHGDGPAPVAHTILPGYGTGGFPITTRVPRAQAFFDNGMQLAHAFAHHASIAAMEEAVRLDPNCAMCLWGQAWASGPTINFGKSEAEIAALAALVDRAEALARTAGTDRERALIAALRLRYQNGGGGKPGDLDFAKAMTVQASEHPQDDEIAVLAADAWLQAPHDGPQDWILNSRLAMSLLEPVLARHPDNSGAIHFYIHASEIAGVPARAERQAERLAALAPRGSHLVHMPSHTFFWVGRYQDAANANRRAVDIDEENARVAAAAGAAPDTSYNAHNISFGLAGALMAGDAELALRLGRPTVARIQASTDAPPFTQLMGGLAYAALGTLAPPAEVLALPEPKLPYTVAAWHYARGETFARQGMAASVRAEAAAIVAAPSDLADDDAGRAARQMSFVARTVLLGRAAMMERQFGQAAILFRQAAEMQEDAHFSDFSDPPAWYYPVRRDLAAALLPAGDTAGARREAEATLAYRPRDPGALAISARTANGSRPASERAR